MVPCPEENFIVEKGRHTCSWGGGGRGGSAKVIKKQITLTSCVDEFLDVFFCFFPRVIIQRVSKGQAVDLSHLAGSGRKCTPQKHLHLQEG